MAAPPGGPGGAAMLEMMGGSMEDIKTAMADLYRLIHGYWFTQGLYVVAELGVPDVLKKSGPLTSEEIAKIVDCNADRLFRVLRGLQNIGFFTFDDQKRFGLTLLSKLLTSDHPLTQRNAVRLNGSPERYGSWMYLLSMVKGGEVGWKQHNKTEIYEYLNHNPEHAKVFNATMTSDNMAIVTAYDFSFAKTVADVGGGEGTLLLKILGKHPSLKGVLIDRPEVQKENEEDATLKDVEKISTDFFAPDGVPGGSDIYILKNVVHDHPIAKNLVLLKNIHSALKASSNPDKCLLIVENVISEDNNKEGIDIAKWLDLVFLVLSDGQELTLTQYKELLRQTGFELEKAIPTKGNGWQDRFIMQAKPIY